MSNSNETADENQDDTRAHPSEGEWPAVCTKRRPLKLLAESQTIGGTQQAPVGEPARKRSAIKEPEIPAPRPTSNKTRSLMPICALDLYRKMQQGVGQSGKAIPALPTAPRRAPGANNKLHAMSMRTEQLSKPVFSIGPTWAVTRYGIEMFDRDYSIPVERLFDRAAYAKPDDPSGLLAHIRRKGSDYDFEGFADALAWAQTNNPWRMRRPRR